LKPPPSPESDQSRDSGSLRTAKEVFNSTVTPAPTNTPNPTPPPPPTRPEQATSALDPYNKGEALRISGDCEAAIPEYDRAIEIDFITHSRSFVNRNAHFFKAYCQGEIGQYENALITYGKIETETHNSIKYALNGPEYVSPALVYFNMGVILHKDRRIQSGFGGVREYYATAWKLDWAQNSQQLKHGSCQYMCGMSTALSNYDLLEQMAP